MEGFCGMLKKKELLKMSGQVGTRVAKKCHTVNKRRI
jgi:hypothetical protein